MATRSWHVVFSYRTEGQNKNPIEETTVTLSAPVEVPTFENIAQFRQDAAAVVGVGSHRIIIMNWLPIAEN